MVILLLFREIRHIIPINSSQTSENVFGTKGRLATRNVVRCCPSLLIYMQKGETLQRKKDSMWGCIRKKKQKKIRFGVAQEKLQSV